jgi:hypothetical protein
MGFTQKKEEFNEKTSLQFNLDGINNKIMKTAGYTQASNRWIRVVSKIVARFHADVYPNLIYIHYDDVCGYKHKTKPHPQLLKGEINRIKGFEHITSKYIKPKKIK